MLDLACGSGKTLCTWARDHLIAGIGVDISTAFGEPFCRREPPDQATVDGCHAVERDEFRLLPELDDAPASYAHYQREYLGWGVFALMDR